MCVDELKFKIARLAMEPGDTLVVSIDQVLSSHQIDAVLDQIHSVVSQDVPVMALAKGATLSVLKPAGATGANAG